MSEPALVAALVQETRLDEFMRLVQAGHAGMPAGVLVTKLGAGAHSQY